MDTQKTAGETTKYAGKYTFYNHLTGMERLISAEEVPHMLEVWVKNGGRPVVDEENKTIINYKA